MKKTQGWRREPARHALASKGIETKMKKSASSRPLALPPEALKSRTAAISNDLKEAAIDVVLARALAEGGDKTKAIALIENDKWLEAEAKKIADREATGFMQRAALKQEIIRSVRKNPPVSDEDGD